MQREPLGDSCQVLPLTGRRVRELMDLHLGHANFDRRVTRIHDGMLDALDITQAANAVPAAHP